MTDKELLELSAKAVGIKLTEHIGALCDYFVNDLTGEDFNPLIDDGCALRLAVDLGLSVYPSENSVSCWLGRKMMKAETKYTDKHAATRRAIVRAAAAIGAKL